MGLVFELLSPPKLFPGFGLVSGTGLAVPDVEGEERRELKPWGREEARREKVIWPVDRERCSSWSPMV